MSYMKRLLSWGITQLGLTDATSAPRKLNVGGCIVMADRVPEPMHRLSDVMTGALYISSQHAAVKPAGHKDASLTGGIGGEQDTQRGRCLANQHETNKRRDTNPFG